MCRQGRGGRFRILQYRGGARERSYEGTAVDTTDPGSRLEGKWFPEVMTSAKMFTFVSLE
jgi:hypothetical protein